MKNIILFITFLVFSHTSWAGFYCESVMDVSTGSACSGIEGFFTKDEMLVTGDAAQFIFEQAKQDKNISVIFHHYKLKEGGQVQEIHTSFSDYKGWSCLKREAVSYKAKIEGAIVKVADNFDGNFECRKPLFEKTKEEEPQQSYKGV